MSHITIDTDGKERAIFAINIIDGKGVPRAARFIVFTSKEDQAAFADSPGIIMNPASVEETKVFWDGPYDLCSGHATRMLAGEDYFFFGLKFLTPGREIFAISATSAHLLDDMRQKFEITPVLDHRYHTAIGELSQWLINQYGIAATQGKLLTPDLKAPALAPEEPSRIVLG